MQDSVFRFANCVVDVGLRELRLDGQRRALEPLPFNLLVMLLRHRDRAVTRDELLDQLWPGEDASLASVASAIAKVRRAIGDSARTPLIRTVHKLGYRFVADVAEELPAAALVSSTGTGAAAVTTVALLPVDNRSGEAMLDWVSSGLAALVGAELAEAEHLLPLPMSAVFAALRQGLGPGDPAQRVQAVHEFTGAQCIVHSVLHREGAELVLDYRLAGTGMALRVGRPELLGGRLKAAEPMQLGRQLSRRLRSLLRRDASPADAASEQPDLLACAGTSAPDGEAGRAGEWNDPWAMEVLAHALQAVAAQQWQRAAHQLTVVLDIEPHHVRAQLELLQAQAHLHVAQGRYGAALDLWRQAETQAFAAGHRRFAARANNRCAQVAVLCGLWDEALRRAEDAVAHALTLSDPSETYLRVNEVCMVYWLTDQALPELPFAQGVMPPPSLAENARAAWWAVKGHYAAQAREHVLAATCFAEGARLFALLGSVLGQQVLQLRCAHALIQAGQYAAVEATLQGIDLEGENTFPFMRRMVIIFQARIAYGRGKCETAFTLLQPIVEEQTFDYPHAYACILCARWHAEAGRIDEACKVLVAIEGSRFQRLVSVRAILESADRSSQA